MNLDTVRRYYTICQTLMAMFLDRRYKVASSGFTMSFEDFFTMFMTEKRMFSFSVRKSNKDNIFVFFPQKVKTGVKELREIVQKMKDLEIQHSLIVLKQKITPFAANRLRSFPNIYIEQFEMKELLFNVTKHVLVPPQRLLSKTQAKAVITKYRGKSSTMFNKIQRNDPIVRHLNARVGRIIEIKRSSPEGHNYLSYRVVVRTPSK